MQTATAISAVEVRRAAWRKRAFGIIRKSSNRESTGRQSTLPRRTYGTASGSERPADGRSVPITYVLLPRRICGIRHRPWDARYRSRLEERGYLWARCGCSPFFEPRAVASVPRTVVQFRSLPSFCNAESAVSGTVRGTLATARGSETPPAAPRAIPSIRHRILQSCQLSLGIADRNGTRNRLEPVDAQSSRLEGVAQAARREATLSGKAGQRERA